MNRAAIVRENIEIAGPAGRIEAVLETPRNAEPLARAVVCHPHPLYGGTLNNKVTFALARAAVEAGAEALRFNFRGIGASAGTYDGGRGEREDLRAVEDWLARRSPALPLWRLGFSFGAAMVLRACLESSCEALVTVAPPQERFAEYGLEHGGMRVRRWMLVQGDADEVVEPQSVLAWAERQLPPPEVVVVKGAGHFFHGRLTELREKVRPFLRAALSDEES